MTEGGRAASPGDENRATDPAGRPDQSRSSRHGRGLSRRSLAGLLFVAPMLVLFVVFRFVPVVGAFLVVADRLPAQRPLDFHCL